MRNDMICPACGELGFPSKALLGATFKCKCDKCGAWAKAAEWEKVKTWKEYRAEVARLKNDNEMFGRIVRIAVEYDWLDSRHGQSLDVFIGAQLGRAKQAAEVVR